jgi:hypothetical protein
MLIFGLVLGYNASVIIPSLIGAPPKKEQSMSNESQK